VYRHPCTLYSIETVTDTDDDDDGVVADYISRPFLSLSV